MNSNLLDKEVRAFEKRPFEDLTIQHAITILTIVATQLDPQNCRGDINRIQAILQQQDFFQEKPEDTRERIQKYVNELKSVDPLKALKSAAKVLLEAGMEEKAFEIALDVAICEGSITTGKFLFLKNISSLLTIPEATADKMIKSRLAGHKKIHQPG